MDLTLSLLKLGAEHRNQQIIIKIKILPENL